MTSPIEYYYISYCGVITKYHHHNISLNHETCISAYKKGITIESFFESHIKKELLKCIPKDYKFKIEGLKLLDIIKRDNCLHAFCLLERNRCSKNNKQIKFDIPQSITKKFSDIKGDIIITSFTNQYIPKLAGHNDRIKILKDDLNRILADDSSVPSPISATNSNSNSDSNSDNNGGTDDDYELDDSELDDIDLDEDKEEYEEKLKSQKRTKKQNVKFVEDEDEDGDEDEDEDEDDDEEEEDEEKEDYEENDEFEDDEEEEEDEDEMDEEIEAELEDDEEDEDDEDDDDDDPIIPPPPPKKSNNKKNTTKVTKKKADIKKSKVKKPSSNSSSNKDFSVLDNILKIDDIDNHELNEIRKKNVQILKKLKLADNQVNKLEKSIYGFAIKKCRSKMIMPTWDNVDFVNIYRNKTISLYSNLKKTSYVGNVQLLDKVNDNKIKIDELAEMDEHKLFADRWRDILDEKVKREQIIRKEASETFTDQFKCPRCYKRKANYIEVQTRSADEPMTTFLTCICCGKKWKIN